MIGNYASIPQMSIQEPIEACEITIKEEDISSSESGDELEGEYDSDGNRVVYITDVFDVRTGNLLHN